MLYSNQRLMMELEGGHRSFLCYIFYAGEKVLNKYLFRKRIKILNVTGLKPAPPGNRPGALTTKPSHQATSKFFNAGYNLFMLLVSL